MNEMIEPLLISLYIFVLTSFLGLELIRKVPPILHTPLMSGSNAISGITVVGAIVTAGVGYSKLAGILGFLAVIFATINVVGGFVVTDRMLGMFQKEKKRVGSRIKGNFLEIGAIFGIAAIILTIVVVSGFIFTDKTVENETLLVYLFSGILFILGLKDLSSPKTASRGNQLAILGMFIAIVVTLFDKAVIDYSLITLGIILGSIIGIVAAKKIQMTAMPQMIALLNGLGGGASGFVALGAYYLLTDKPQIDFSMAMALSLFIGALTFSGSIVAFAKLQEIVKPAPLVFKLQHPFNLFLLFVSLSLFAIILIDPSLEISVLLLGFFAVILGISVVIRIGGADMPIVIAVLNSFSGLAAAATGFVLSNDILIISGALVGASGLILTRLMCRAMNRSLANVVFGAVGSISADTKKDKRDVINYTEEDVATILEGSQSVIIVPGYGLAASRAQHVLHELAKILINKAINVRYAIHPVAGRMPGHMNILLVEANVPYELLFDLDEINEDFQDTDVVLVVGANDVINPAARIKKDSPLYGMPILNADKAKTVIIYKRSLSPGFAGVDNELFYDQKTMMIFGDAKETLTKIVGLLKD